MDNYNTCFTLKSITLTPIVKHNHIIQEFQCKINRLQYKLNCFMQIHLFHSQPIYLEKHIQIGQTIQNQLQIYS